MFYSYRRICYATMEREAANAAVRELRGELAWHNGNFTSWSKKRDDDHQVPAGAGEVIGVDIVDRTPWDKFTTELEASPVRPEEPEPTD